MENSEHVNTELVHIVELFRRLCNKASVHYASEGPGSTWRQGSEYEQAARKLWLEWPELRMEFEKDTGLLSTYSWENKKGD